MPDLLGDAGVEMPSEASTQKAYDPITAMLINQTPTVSQAVQAIASAPIINPLAVLRGAQPGPDVMPSVIARAIRANDAREAAQTRALVADDELHQARLAKLQTEQERIALNTMREVTTAGQAGVGAAYKAFMDISEDMDPARATEWLKAMVEGDSEAALESEGAGRAYALRKLLEVGGIRGQAPRAPSGYQFAPDGSLAPIPGGPADPATAGRLAASRRKPAGPAKAAKADRSRLYAIQTDEGDILVPREQAIGQVRAPTRTVGTRGERQPRAAAQKAAPAPPPAPAPAAEPKKRFRYNPDGTIEQVR